ECGFLLILLALTGTFALFQNFTSYRPGQSLKGKSLSIYLTDEIDAENGTRLRAFPDPITLRKDQHLLVVCIFNESSKDASNVRLHDFIQENQPVPPPFVAGDPGVKSIKSGQRKCLRSGEEAIPTALGQFKYSISVDWEDGTSETLDPKLIVDPF
ncbi:MAG TPA: hypothetical protein VFV50_10965, partial [Bdellovibrionales bacterium]|nr:hypothetical protein [Bdellovibrionales bacterium]